MASKKDSQSDQSNTKMRLTAKMRKLNVQLDAVSEEAALSQEEEF